MDFAKQQVLVRRQLPQAASLRLIDLMVQVPSNETLPLRLPSWKQRGARRWQFARSVPINSKRLH